MTRLRATAGAALAAVLTVAVGAVAAKLSLPQAPALEAPLGTRADCAAYGGLPAGWGSAAHAGMIRIEAGQFALGSERGYAEERPLREATVDAFWIDRTEVTNAQFASFVAATGYISDAQRRPGAVAFRAPGSSDPLTPGSWWTLQQGADWRHPEGPDSSIEGRAHEPVVNVSYADALAYAHWLGRALPSETQWEYAAKAGRSNRAADRSLRDALGQPQANFWQGMFPLHNTGEDGFPGRAPVGCFKASPNGLYDMVGNVWEWTTDRYQDGHAGTHEDASLADRLTAIPAAAGASQRVIKGGSYLCSADYCVRARAASRQGQEADLPAVHLGFRTVSAPS